LGSAGKKRRDKRPLPKVTAPTSEQGFEQFPNTIEGTMSGLGSFTRGVNASSRSGDHRLRNFGLAFLGLLFAFAIVAWLASVL
jgi:hypothetical protein